MTNEQIIFEEVNNKYRTAEQRRAILALAYTPEQLAAKCAQIRFKDLPDDQQTAEAEKVLLAGLFHTFQEWKRHGKSVKTGEKAAIKTRLWKMDDRPRKEKKDLTPDALTKAAQDQRPDGNYYKAPAHLFHIGQVEDSKSAPAGRFKSLDEIRAYNKMLADQRKAAKAAAEQAKAASPAPLAVDLDKLEAEFQKQYGILYDSHNDNDSPEYTAAVKEFDTRTKNDPAFHALVDQMIHKMNDFISSDREAAAFIIALHNLTTPAEKPAKAPATKPAATKKAAQKPAQPAPDALHAAERSACAAFLAVPETDRKGQAAALEAWRKTRKAETDAKTSTTTPAPVEIAPVQQLDFESIAAGLLA